jgi:flagella basal body P-ring formation protein FlgA
MPQNEKSKNTCLFLMALMMAVLAQMVSMQLAHGETFLPDDRLVHGLTVEVRPGATVEGNDIHLRQIARWSDADRATLDPIGDLVVARFGQGTAFATVAISDVKALLRDAGVNVATMNFAGATECQVNRSDAVLPAAASIDQYVAANVAQTPAKAQAVVDLAPTAPAKSVEEIPAAETPDSPYHTLRQLLVADLSQRINVPAEDLQVTFRPQDEASLRLSEPHVGFDVQPQRAAQLGEVSWNVNIISNDQTKRVFVRASARAWRQQTVVSKPLATKQLITENDVVTSRRLVDTLPQDTTLDRDQVVGQLASRDLKAGSLMTSRLVDPVQLVRAGQFVTLSTGTGGIEVKTVAKALEPGSMGQTILVRNEVTKEQFSAVITGDQQVSLASK